jgi:hypothetical protein
MRSSYYLKACKNLNPYLFIAHYYLWDGPITMADKSKKTTPRMIIGKSAATPNIGGVSSPASTGGAGVFFEQHVDAFWLALLLVRGIPPILHDCTVVEVHLQTENLHWCTDDFLIVGQNGSGDHRKLAGQVKRTFTVSASDDECKKAILDFWTDFKNPLIFSQSVDRFALVVQRGTNTLLGHFSGLLDCSRAARDAAEFEHRLETPGFLNTKSVQYCNEIQTIIGNAEGRSISAAEVWSFLQVLHILSLDLNSDTRQTEAFIKTLLAYTTSEHDAMGAAENSWNELVVEVSRDMSKARKWCREDLPKELRQCHSPIGGVEQRALRALADHSTLILNGIHATIGKDLHLSRGRLVQKVLEQLESAQVVLLSGPAGGGKSGIAKDAIGVLATDHFTFSFRAEEFAHAHFDETLNNSQIPVNAATLGAIMAGQGRKIMIVESIERLLEKSTRDAFTDLMTLISKDKSWRLVLTCRDYSTDLVRACFLESAGVGHSVVPVPLLNDGELDEVKAYYQALAIPIANEPLRRILRNPYFMDKALKIKWSEDRPLPQSERDFHLLFWKDIVRANQYPVGGMPHRRENAFMDIALRRARELTMYVACNDLDQEVVDSLRHDSLVVSSPESDNLVAPAHDVLEDWAILNWINEQYLIFQDSVKEFSNSIGLHPAIRRTYRKWVTELVEREPIAADKLFQSVMNEGVLTDQFSDDTLVSILQSSSSTTFLERHSAELFLNNMQPIGRVIYILRVACVTIPDWLQNTSAHASLFNVPVGQAWASVLRLVQNHIKLFAQEDCSLLLGLIEDWAKGVTWQNPYPEGAESAVAIAYWLLPYFNDYQSEDQRKRLLHVIAKVPNADREGFLTLLQKRQNDKVRDRSGEYLRKIIFEGMDGISAARDMPKEFIAAAKNYILCSEADLRMEFGYASGFELETLFGVNHTRAYDFFPASALHGPFFRLLHYHPSEGLAFMIDIFNHSADWYARPRVQNELVESPFEISLVFSDGTSHKQWCNDRLWCLYRGTSVGPCILQSLLMALERWLLEYAKAYPRDFDNVLLRILRDSNSASLTAVVASVATAFPRLSGETLLVLLRSRNCIQQDRIRLAYELRAPSRVFNSMPQLAKDKIYDDERKRADILPHRHQDLETAIINLQCGPFASHVHKIIDRHRAEIPLVDERDEEERVWLLALHRMDLRQYTPTEDASGASNGPDNGKSLEGGQKFICLDLKMPEPDIKEMVDRSAAQFQTMNNNVSLVIWGLKVFCHEECEIYDPAQWRQKLQEARSIGVLEKDIEGHYLSRDGPGLVAAVCTRDHWEEMSGEEQVWCLNIVCSEVEREANNWNHIARIQRNSMSADRRCAWVLPILIGKSLDSASSLHVRQVLVVALTHANEEVRLYSAQGIGTHLWAIDRELTIRCVNALAMEATFIQKAIDRAAHPYFSDHEITTISIKAASLIRKGFFETGGIPDDAYQTLDTTRGFGAEANLRILMILEQVPAELVAIAAFNRLSYTLVGWWDADDDRRPGQEEWRSQRNHFSESAMTDLLESFLLRTSIDEARTIIKPIVDAIDGHPEEAHRILLGLINREYNLSNTEQFWSLWEMFADKALHAEWLSDIDSEHTSGKSMISALFLGQWWKEDVHHWRSLEGYAWHIGKLFEDMPISSTVLNFYVKFLYSIGEQSLPEAFIHIANRLKGGDPQKLMEWRDSIFLLEELLQRYVYGKPLELKRQKDLREAVLFLLDQMVESGSSAAFRMRDDFVTPISSN